jgi:hypothetical protein
MRYHFPPLTQVVLGIGSVAVALALVLEPRLISLRYMMQFFGLTMAVLLIPLVLFIGGLALAFIRLGYVGYRIAGAPLILYMIFVISKLSSFGPAWYPVSLLLATFLARIIVTRRYL